MAYQEMKLYACLCIAVYINEYIYPPPPLATILAEESVPESKHHGHARDQIAS